MSASETECSNSSVCITYYILIHKKLLGNYLCIAEKLFYTYPEDSTRKCQREENRQSLFDYFKSTIMYPCSTTRRKTSQCCQSCLYPDGLYWWRRLFPFHLRLAHPLPELCAWRIILIQLLPSGLKQHVFFLKEFGGGED
jgi:hypothetical protein